MLVLFVTISISVFAVPMFDEGEDAGPKDIYVRLGVPKLERCDYRIHVGKKGNWTFHSTQTYSIKGVTSESVNALEEMLIEQARENIAHASVRFDIGKNRLQCDCEGECGDSLALSGRHTIGNVHREFHINRC